MDTPDAAPTIHESLDRAANALAAKAAKAVDEGALERARETLATLRAVGEAKQLFGR